MVLHVIVNIPHVPVRQITHGMVALAFVTVHLNMLVREPDIVREMGRHAAENIRVVLVLIFMIGTAVLVCIRIVMCVRADIRLLIPV